MKKNKTNQMPQENYWKNQHEEKSKNNMVWWVIGWIFFFPLPLTMVLVKNKKINSVLKYSIIGVMWTIIGVISLIMFLVVDQSGSNDDYGDRVALGSESNAEETAEVSLEDNIVSFVERFNTSSDVDLEFYEDFTPSDNSSIHYQHEFRLNPYSDAIGKSYKYGETYVDIVARPDMFKDCVIRIYMERSGLRECEDVIKYASPVMDTEIKESDINEALNQIKEGNANHGYYYGNLCVVISKNKDEYGLMLKNSND